MRHVPQHLISEEAARGLAIMTAWAPAHLDPEETAVNVRHIPGVAPYIADTYTQATGHPIGQESIEFFNHTVSDTDRALKRVGFGGVSLEDRLRFATDPASIYALSSLANRSEYAKESAIADYPGGRTIIDKSSDGAHLVLREYFHSAAQTGPHCPYARDFSDPEQVHKLFASAVPWIARTAIYIEELYRK